MVYIKKRNNLLTLVRKTNINIKWKIVLTNIKKYQSEKIVLTYIPYKWNKQPKLKNNHT